MRVWILARTTGEPGWVESSCGVDVGISRLKVGQMQKQIAVTSAPYLPPRALRMHEELLRFFGLRPGLRPSAYIKDDHLLLGPLVGVMVGDLADLLYSAQVRKLVSASHEVGCLLFFFHPQSVKIGEGTVSGLNYSPTPGWESRDMPLPDVIYDQMYGCPTEIKEYLLRGGARPLNQPATNDGSSLLASIAEPGDFELQGQGSNKALVLMQRDDLGAWHFSFLPEVEHSPALLGLCRRAVHEVERVTGCLGEVQFRISLLTTGRCRIDSVDYLPDKRGFGEEAYKLPLLFSRRLAGFPPVTEN